VNEKELLELKEKIEYAKSEMAELTGRKNYLIQELNEKWDCSDITEANQKLKQMEIEIDNLEKNIKTRIKQIEEKL